MAIKRILVMDDDAVILEVAITMLRHLGYEPVACSKGEDAVELYRLGREQKVPFEAVILDLKVEHGMGGLEAAEAILALDPKARLIVSTGCPGSSSRCKSLFKHSLPKPYTIEELEKVLTAL